MKNLKTWKSIALASLLAAMVGSAAPGVATGETGKWDTAGKEIKEAAQAVGKASEESAYKAMDEAGKAWETAREKSRQSLDVAKKKYEDEMEKAKAMLHKATAPKDESEDETEMAVEQHEPAEKP